MKSKKVGLSLLLLSFVSFVAADMSDGLGTCGMMAGKYGWGMGFGWLIMILVVVVLVLLIIWLSKQIWKK